MGPRALGVAMCAMAMAGCLDEVPPPDPAPPDPIPTVLGAFAPCDDAALVGFDCALLTIQLDPDDPLAGTAALPVARATAPDPAARRGVLVYHPGGPGIGLLDSLPLLVERLFQTAPEVLEAFDIVVVETPGIGAGAPLIACEQETFDAFSALPDLPPDAAGEEAAAAAMLAMAEGCVELSGETLLQQAGVDGATRAIDELRRALGEAQIALVGVSYGSLVGAAYARTHGEHLSALVLDSVLSPQPDPIARIAVEAVAQERTLDAFFDWCAATTACPFFRVGGADAVAQAFDAIVAAADDAPIGGTVDGTEVTNLTRALIDSVGFRLAGEVLALMAAGTFDPALIDFGATPQEGQANIAILGGDFHPPAGASLAGHYAALRDARRTHPRARPLGAPWSIVWPLARPSPAVDVPPAFPTLIVGGALDVATPIEDRAAMVAAFPGATTLTSRGAGHGQLFSSQCVAHGVADFLIDGVVPGADCDDERFVLDASPAGTIATAFVVDDASTRQGESGPGDFIADAMRAATGTTIAMVNAGAMQRGSGLPSRVRHQGRGEDPLQLIVADFYDLLPFGGVAVTRTLTAAGLFATLEHGVASLPSPTNALVLPSGFSYAVDPTQPPGARVTSVTLDDGTALSRDGVDVVTVTLDSFMAGGNGGFTMLGGVSTAFVAPLPALVAAHALRVGEVPVTPAGRIVLP